MTTHRWPKASTSQEDYIEFNCVDCGQRTRRAANEGGSAPFYLMRFVCVSCQKPDDVIIGKPEWIKDERTIS